MLRTFMDRYVAGEVEPDDIDDFVEEWHKGTIPLSLSEYLGMSPEEYRLWIMDADALPRIRAERQIHA